MKEKILLHKVKKLQKDAINKGVFSLFNSKEGKKIFRKGLNYDALEFFYDLYKGWDETSGDIPIELGDHLESLIDDPNLLIGIHRTGTINYPDNLGVLESIFENGLINNGDGSSGIFTDRPEPDKTISFVGNILNLIIMLKSSYKDSTGAVLVGIPAEYMDENKCMRKECFDDIYDTFNGLPVIRKEFMLGYLTSVNGNYRLITKEEVLQNKKNTSF